MTSLDVGLVCPHCGKLVRIIGDATPEENRDVDIESVLQLFKPSIRRKIRSIPEGDFARIELKGKLSKESFNEVLHVVLSYGGHYIKGYFKLPLAGVEM